MAQSFLHAGQDRDVIARLHDDHPVRTKPRLLEARSVEIRFRHAPQDLPGQAAVTGEYFLTELRALRERYADQIVEVRGLGLLIGLEFVDAEFGYSVAAGLFRRGIAESVPTLMFGTVLAEDIAAVITRTAGSASPQALADAVAETAIVDHQDRSGYPLVFRGALFGPVIDGNVETGSIMAGQSVGMVTREEPVADIIRELIDEAAAALESRG